MKNLIIAREFTIDKDYDASLRNKIAAVSELTKGKKSPQMTLITTYGLIGEVYSRRVIWAYDLQSMTLLTSGTTNFLHFRAAGLVY